MGESLRQPSRGLVALLAVALAALSGCGGGNGTSASSASAQKGNPGGSIIYRPKYEGKVITVGAIGGAEDEILAEIFAQAYETDGFTVHRRFNLPSVTAAHEALRKGEISGFPVDASLALFTFYGFRPDQVPRSGTGAALAVVKELLKEKLNMIGPAYYTKGWAIAATSANAEKDGLTKISDLKSRAGTLTIAGPPHCRTEPECVPAIENTYGIHFGHYRSIDQEERYAVLSSGKADLAMVHRTDPQLAPDQGEYRMLADDKHALVTTGMIWATRSALTLKWFPDFTKWVREPEKALKQPLMQELMARVELEGETPAEAATAYLKEGGFIG
jgi:osmoprotectant transport system substrate-binding protein